MELTNALEKLPPFHNRPIAALAAFKFQLTKDNRLSREEICRLLNEHSIRADKSNDLEYLKYKYNITHQTSGDRNEFWSAHSTHAFSLAPAGHGIDTHRLWESLNLHTVPIVLSSSLDPLYTQFPIVIVQQWSEVFESGALERFREQIRAKFGKEDPFEDPGVGEKLTEKYWVDLVHAAL